MAVEFQSLTDKIVAEFLSKLSEGSEVDTTLVDRLKTILVDDRKYSLTELEKAFLEVDVSE